MRTPEADFVTRNAVSHVWSSMVVLALATAASPARAQSTPALSLAPLTLNFEWTRAAGARPPVAQNAQVKLTGSSTPLMYSVAVTPANQWLIATPSSAKTGTPVSVQVNPSGLTAGTYSGTVTVSASGVPARFGCGKPARQESATGDHCLRPELF
jgi:hypothetical protein